MSVNQRGSRYKRLSDILFASLLKRVLLPSPHLAQIGSPPNPHTSIVQASLEAPPDIPNSIAANPVAMTVATEIPELHESAALSPLLARAGPGTFCPSVAKPVQPQGFGWGLMTHARPQ